jgi:hypothetical protein
MWVLFLAVASIFAFLSITLLLWLADALETRASRSQRKYNIGSPFIVISIAQAFEPVLALLWEAPIYALELVQAGGASGIPVSAYGPFSIRLRLVFPKFTTGMVSNIGSNFSKTFTSSTGADCKSHSHGGREFLEYRFTTQAVAQV